MKIDMNGQKCKKCKKGIYKETSLLDDLDGVLHCDVCDDEIDRYINENIKIKKFNDFIFEAKKIDYTEMSDKELNDLVDPKINKGPIPIAAVKEHQKRNPKKYTKGRGEIWGEYKNDK